MTHYYTEVPPYVIGLTKSPLLWKYPTLYQVIMYAYMGENEDNSGKATFISCSILPSKIESLL